MKIKPVNYVLVLCAAIFFLGCASPAIGVGNPPDDPQAQNRPVIVFAETRFDFKSILDGDVITHDFIFKNTGSEELKVTSVKAG